MTDGAPVEPSELARTGPIRRRLHFVLGVVFLAIAVLGVLLPLLPTTPFLLLASYSFARSQPRLQQWLRRSPVFGRLLEDWERARGVRKRVKIVAVLVVLAMVALALWKQQLSGWQEGALVGLASIGIAVVLRLRTIDG